MLTGPRAAYARGRVATVPTALASLIRVGRYLGLALVLTGIGTTGAEAQQPRREMLRDGVEHWTSVQSSGEQGRFFTLFERLKSFVVPGESQPFGRSVAFLAGVSQYETLSDLPFVREDLDDVLEYLLNEGGFDEVFVAREAAVSSEIIEDYMMNRFPRDLGPRDRLLFYYAGHGDDAPNGTTGYLQFRDARPGDFARSVLGIQTRSMEWSAVNRAGHMLLVFDACASGFGFGSRDGGDFEQKLLNALAGEGSRAVLTAGTGTENTFEVQNLDGTGNGVFTRAFLNALAGAADAGNDGFITTPELIARIQREVAEFEARYGESLSPRMWELQQSDYPGTFVFLNPAPGLPLRSEHREALGPLARSGNLAPDTSPNGPPPATPTPPPGAEDPVWIGGGTFQMGSMDGTADERPVRAVTVSGFWIQEHEVTNEEYRRFVPGHQFPGGQEIHPVVSVNWQQAMDYAVSRGGSLPTEAQWEFAARGEEGRTYPWVGGELDDSRANFGDSDRGTRSVGSYRLGATPEGVHDLAGNVWEWVADWYGPYGSADATDPTGPASGTSRVLRGGSGLPPFSVPGVMRV